MPDGLQRTEVDDFQYRVDDDEPPSQAVVEAVAEVSNRPAHPSDSTIEEGQNPLPPLYSALDPCVLDTLFDSADTDLTVSFSYADYRLTVRDRRVIVSGPSR